MRPNLGAVALLALILPLAGCGVLGRTPPREVVVHFAPSATPAQHLAARKACSGLPNAQVEPLPTNSLESSQVGDVRFRVDKAGDVDLARLYECLHRQPGVVGVDIPATM